VCKAADSTGSAASRRELLAGGLIAANIAFLSQMTAPARAEDDVIAAAVADPPAAEAAVAEVSSSSSVAATSGAKQAG
jgi:acyl-coenzyme A thioesterase PaaI-like protein